MRDNQSHGILCRCIKSHATRKSSEPRRPHVISVTLGSCLNKDMAWKQKGVRGTGWAQRETSILIKCYTVPLPGLNTSRLVAKISFRTNKMTASFSNYHPQPRSALRYGAVK